MATGRSTNGSARSSTSWSLRRDTTTPSGRSPRSPRRARAAASEPGQQRLRAAAHKHTVAARREVLAQVEDGLRRSRTVALVGHLQDGERGVSHERTRTRALLPIRHLRYKAYFSGFTAYVSQTRSLRPARAQARANEARQNSCTCPGLYVGA